MLSQLTFSTSNNQYLARALRWPDTLIQQSSHLRYRPEINIFKDRIKATPSKEADARRRFRRLELVIGNFRRLICSFAFFDLSIGEFPVDYADEVMEGSMELMIYIFLEQYWYLWILEWYCWRNYLICSLFDINFHEKSLPDIFKIKNNHGLFQTKNLWPTYGSFSSFGQPFRKLKWIVNNFLSGIEINI